MVSSVLLWIIKSGCPETVFFSKFKVGDTIEYSEQTIRIFLNICNHLIQHDGVLLVIDYGNVSGMGETPFRL